jgi:hypothetical protein
LLPRRFCAPHDATITERFVPPTIISRKSSNWVDRGEPAGPTLRRVLAALFSRDVNSDARWLGEHAEAILAMVAADATEIHVAGYLRSIASGLGHTGREARDMRTEAIALWHVAKAALVRDFAERVLSGDVPANAATDDSLSHWIAGKLLTPAELAEFEAQARDIDEQGA